MYDWVDVEITNFGGLDLLVTVLVGQLSALSARTGMLPGGYTGLQGVSDCRW